MIPKATKKNERFIFLPELPNRNRHESSSGKKNNYFFKKADNLDEILRLLEEQKLPKWTDMK